MGWYTLDVLTFQLLTSLVLGAVPGLGEARVLTDDSQIIQARWETEALRWASQTTEFTLQPGLKRNAAPHVESRSTRDPFLRPHGEVSERILDLLRRKTTFYQWFIWTPRAVRSSYFKSAITFCRIDDQLDRNCTSVTASGSQNAEWVHLHAEQECDAFKEWERSRAAGRGGRLRFHYHWSLSCWDLWRLVGVHRVVIIVKLLLCDIS